MFCFYKLLLTHSMVGFGNMIALLLAHPSWVDFDY